MASISAALQLAVQHHGAGRLDLAEQIYRRILAVESNHPDVLHLLGVVCHQTGRHEVAVSHIEHAIQLNGNRADFHSNLAAAYVAVQRIAEAVASYQRAVQLEPNNADLHYNLGGALQKQGLFVEAAASYQRALNLKPNHAPAHNNLGVALKDLGKLDEAIACYRRALQLKPDYRDAYANLANALKDQGDLAGSLRCDQRVLELSPGYAAGHSNLLYTLQFSPDYDSRRICEEHRKWNQQHAAPLAKLIQPHTNDRSPGRPLRIGYVSPDFRNHCQAYFTKPLLSAHDHQDFQVFCYADVTCPDDVTEQIRSYADVWRNIAGLADEQVAHLIRQDRIDILVDLTMHMARNRLLVFARKPAPVQVSWLAYPGTTGLTAIDYRLTDPYLDPPDADLSNYAEQSIRLPDCFWCYDPLTAEPVVNALPAAEKGYLTFGCLNNFCKVNDQVVRLWSRVLRAVDRSRLMILAPEGEYRRQTLELFSREGVASERVTLVPKQSRARYLATYHQIDVGLDTFPYNGHTTSLDSFWMGVPVITLVGPTVVGRAGLCQLQNLGLPELIAHTWEQFVDVAVDLTNDLDRLTRLRATLRDRLQSCPLMDAARFAKNVEAAYRAMWQQWCST